MRLDHLEARFAENAVQIFSWPSIGTQDGVLEGFARSSVEVTEHELSSRPEGACELGDRRADGRRLVVDGREPGEDAPEGSVGGIDVVDALKAEPDAGVGRPGVLDERRHGVDPMDVQSELRQIVRPVTGTAASVEDAAAQVCRPRVNELTVGGMYRGHGAQESRVFGGSS